MDKFELHVKELGLYIHSICIYASKFISTSNSVKRSWPKTGIDFGRSVQGSKMRVVLKRVRFRMVGCQASLVHRQKRNPQRKRYRTMRSRQVVLVATIQHQDWSQKSILLKQPCNRLRQITWTNLNYM